ncbi:MAG: T9SS type A sorting domain-containing protein [Prolixibacteraceae bacterium]|nr:T9SS type A sorting domain-containing protein [Prolixibacteraceae bacterium]
MNVDISSISKGIYFVNIINDNANIFTKKIVKQ